MMHMVVVYWFLWRCSILDHGPSLSLEILKYHPGQGDLIIRAGVLYTQTLAEITHANRAINLPHSSPIISFPCNNHTPTTLIEDPTQRTSHAREPRQRIDRVGRNLFIDRYVNFQVVARDAVRV
ncbi:hypothetical protein B0J17DRAFT_657829 [Rhizoctonia solani]|nr:hypothetical protein B0J17DRAFT_657829 [Rhizoctonia solani]